MLNTKHISFEKIAAFLLILIGIVMNSSGGSIYGKVIDENSVGVKDAKISYKRLELETQFDTDGNFRFEITNSSATNLANKRSDQISMFNNRIVIKITENIFLPLVRHK